MKNKNKILRIGIIVILVAVIGAFFAWQYINQGVDDLTNAESEITYTTSELIALATNAEENQDKIGKIVTVSGTVVNVKNDKKFTTIELAEPDDLSSVVITLDSRHNEKVNLNKPIICKGKLVGLSADDMGLGSTAEIKNAVIIH